MGNLAIVLTLVVLTIVVLAVGLRLRGTSVLGGSVQLKDPTKGRLAINSSVSKQVIGKTAGKQVLSISMQTRRVNGGEARSTETITIDGQTYQSIEEIPPDVRDRVRELLAKARTQRSPADPNAGDALVRIENDLAALGLNLRDSGGSPEAPREGPREEPPPAG